MFHPLDKISRDIDQNNGVDGSPIWLRDSYEFWIYEFASSKMKNP
jgi:hypothetical protein